MKILLVFVLTLLLLQSCQNKSRQNHPITSNLIKLDELDIVFYTKDTFIYKTSDTSEINFFSDLISDDNEVLSDTCETTGQLIYKSKGEQKLVAKLSIMNVKDNISCDYITYLLNSKIHRHRLSYRAGMAIDGIYWRKIDPAGNPSTGLDSTKFRYEEKTAN